MPASEGYIAKKRARGIKEVRECLIVPSSHLPTVPSSHRPTAPPTKKIGSEATSNPTITIATRLRTSF